MKTTYEILKETITTSRKLELLVQKENNFRKQPKSRCCENDPSIEGELNAKITNLKNELEEEKEFSKLNTEIANQKTKLDTFLWLYEDKSVQ